MRLALIVLVALSIVAHSQQATFTVFSSSNADIYRLFSRGMIRVDSKACRASFKFCNSCSVNLLDGQTVCTEMYCDNDRRRSDRLMAEILTEHGKRICDEAKKVEFADSITFRVFGNSGSITFVCEAK